MKKDGLNEESINLFSVNHSVSLIKNIGNVSKFLILILMLDNCSTVHQSKQLTKYLDSFNREYHIHITRISLLFVNSFPKKTEIARCYPLNKTIMVSKEHWNELGEIERKIVIYHELAHCYFDRGHREDIYLDECPRSIMYPTILSEKCYLKHEEELLEELIAYK